MWIPRILFALTTWALAGVTLSLPSEAGASPARADTVPARIEAVLLHLPAWKRVRVETAAGHRFEGRLHVSDRYGLTLESAEGTRVGMAGVNRVWVKSNHAKAGAIGGGIVGLVGGLWIGKMAADECQLGQSCNGGQWITSLGIVGLLGGAGFGALLGMVSPRWVQRFP